MKIVISKSQWEQIGRIAGWQDGYLQSTNPLNPTNPLNSTRMTLEDIWRNQTKNNIHPDDETMLEDFVRKAINANYSQADIVEGLTEFYRQHAEVGTNIYNRVLERINKGRQSKESKRIQENRSHNINYKKAQINGIEDSEEKPREPREPRKKDFIDSDVRGMQGLFMEFRSLSKQAIEEMDQWINNGEYDISMKEAEERLSYYIARMGLK